MARGGHGHRDCDGGAAFEVPLLSGGGGMIVARPNQRTCRGGISAPTTLRLARSAPTPLRNWAVCYLRADKYDAHIIHPLE